MWDGTQHCFSGCKVGADAADFLIFTYTPMGGFGYVLHTIFLIFRDGPI